MTVIRRFWPQILIVVAVVLVWGNTVRYDFVWDDQSFVTELRSIRSLGNIGAMFHRLDAQSAVPEEFVLFRPLRTVQYALLFQLGGGETPKAWLFHLNNLAWHTIAALLLFGVTRQLLKWLAPAMSEKSSTWFAVIVAAGFAVNPVTAETVCWVKSLDDIMAAVFVLAAMQQLLRPELTRRCLWLAVTFFALAIYSKISAGPFPLLACIVFLVVRKMEWRRAVLCSMPFFAVAFAFVIHNHLVIGRSSQTAPISGSYAQTMIDMLPVVPQYMRLLFGIPPFLIDYSHMKGGHALLSAPVICGALLLLLLGGLAFWAIRTARWQLAGFGLIWTGLFLIPVSNLLPMMQYMAERFLYLPLIGWCLAAVAALWMLPRMRLVVPVAVSVVVFWAILAWDRSSIWQDNFTLFVRSSQQGVRVQRIEENAVAAILMQPHMTNVFVRDPRHRKNPVTIRPPANPEAWNPVLATLQQAYELFPEDTALLMSLGAAHYFTAQPQAAASFFEKVVLKTPENIGAWINLGRAASESRQYVRAEQAFRAAVELQPANVIALRGLARALSEQHKDTEALRVAEQNREDGSGGRGKPSTAH
ncbi:MAG TPA: hypothetical protein VNT99_12180 [Methylomirabilota bacterium]|nr:hypothetical protein [Methylomirabilota bacterium]